MDASSVCSGQFYDSKSTFSPVEQVMADLTVKLPKPKYGQIVVLQKNGEEPRGNVTFVQHGDL